MPSLPIAIVAGLIGGLVASAVMNGYQAATASFFGQDESDSDPANVKAANDAKQATVGAPLKRKNKEKAGSLVHYVTGAAIGIVYGALVFYWPPAAIGFGVAFGIVVALVLDEALVPVFGWGPPPWATPLATHAYGISAHMVFGAALEGVRRLCVSLL